MFCGARAALLVALAGAVGCSQAYVPSRESINREIGVSQESPPVWHLPHPTSGTWLYQRYDLTSDTTTPIGYYVKQIRANVQGEGVLAGRSFEALANYLQRDDRPAEPMPAPLLAGRFLMIVELDTPAPVYPPVLRVDQPDIVESDMTMYDAKGKAFLKGHVRRTAEAEGYEDVTTPTGVYPRCKRVRIHLEFDLPFGMYADVVDYRWFADDVGIVQRREIMTALIWIFWMRGAYEYQLQAFLPGPSAPTTSAAEDAIDWSRIAVLFDRTFPHPRVAGMYIEFAEPGATAPTSSPSRQSRGG